MRLLNVHTYKLHTFYGDAIPKYAILSHTWLAADEEVTFLHLQTQEATTWRRLPGAKKIFYTCQQARDDGHTWAWVDTCCIDKSNNAELSEAINSMFRWYQTSEVCYVYLSDYVYRPNSDLFTSRWWTRAWTLQELVAPEHVRFFDAHWQEIGTKSDRAHDIALRTSIDVETLHDSKLMYLQCVAQRMSWAAHREATREEDLAYSLLGIFNINMTMQYGEGEKAFVRLQQEITRTTCRFLHGDLIQDLWKRSAASKLLDYTVWRQSTLLPRWNKFLHMVSTLIVQGDSDWRKSRISRSTWMILVVKSGMECRISRP